MSKYTTTKQLSLCKSNKMDDCLIMIIDKRTSKKRPLQIEILDTKEDKISIDVIDLTKKRKCQFDDENVQKKQKLNTNHPSNSKDWILHVYDEIEFKHVYFLLNSNHKLFHNFMLSLLTKKIPIKDEIELYHIIMKFFNENGDISQDDISQDDTDRLKEFFDVNSVSLNEFKGLICSRIIAYTFIDAIEENKSGKFTVVKMRGSKLS